MTSIALEFTYHTDIILVPNEIGAKIKKYQNLFDTWLYNKDNNHDNWILKHGQKYAVAICQLFERCSPKRLQRKSSYCQKAC